MWRYLSKVESIIAVAVGLIAIGGFIRGCSTTASTEVAQSAATPPAGAVGGVTATGSLTVKPAHNPTRVDSSGKEWSCEGVAEDQKQALAAAKRVYSSTDRDNALLGVARNSICHQNFDTFEQAVEAMYYTGNRDKVYMDAVIFMVERRGLSVAQKYAEKIHVTTARDKALKLIVDAAASAPNKQTTQ